MTEEEMDKEETVTISDDCIACGACESVNEPDQNMTLFEVKGEISHFVYQGEITAEVKDKIEEAIDGCPTQAIKFGK